MANKNDLVIDQGATYSTIIYLVDNANNPFPLTGYISSAQMKRTFTSLTAIPFTTSINAVAGSITLQLASTVTANIVHNKYVYDVIITDASNNITRIVEGIVTVTPGVTNLSVETTPNTYNVNSNFIVVPLDG